VRERDQSRHVAVGAGAPSDPDAPEAPSEPGGNGHSDPGEDPTASTAAPVPTPRTTDDVIQAVTDFLDDLIDDPTFAHDPPDRRRPTT